MYSALRNIDFTIFNNKQHKLVIRYITLLSRLAVMRHYIRPDQRVVVSREPAYKQQCWTSEYYEDPINNV